MDKDRLYRRIDYRFRDETLAERALTHRSYGQGNNERLEFLGDAILSFVIAEELYRRFGGIREGDLSRMRASLVKGKTLAGIARRFDLGDFLNLGPGEMKSGGHRRESILADALEALIGAVYLDSDFDTCRAQVLKWFDERLQAVTTDSSYKDAKTRLQEYLQARRQPLPSYTVVNTAGEAHAQQFEVSCEVTLLAEPVVAVGGSRKKAEQEAASLALARLQEVRDDG